MKPPQHPLYQYLTDRVSFRSGQALRLRTVYLPLCGVDAASLKSVITPGLSGDIKIDKHTYVTKPVSREDLRGGLRDFFVLVNGKKVVSLAQGAEASGGSVEIGPLWHRQTRQPRQSGLELEAVNFIPVTGETVELMRVTVRNVSRRKLRLTPTAAVPIFGRGLANKHDHEHVTALLHRTRQVAEGVFVQPTMSFDERGHAANRTGYFVFGVTGRGGKPAGSFPTVDAYFGDGGTFDRPAAVFENHRPRRFSPAALNGKEAVGALRFADVSLAPGGSQTFYLAIGTADGLEPARKMFRRFATPARFAEAFEKNKTFWSGKIRSIQFQTGDADVNSWLGWVTLQPVFRRIFGNSFLPDHDYGKGGKGWRDLWQDLLSLILIEPSEVRQTLLNNFAGVRIDGSNATIIGSGPGEFLADRNAITRVWMDHGAWPLMTMLLYLGQTGDYDLLLVDSPYFRDPQQYRTFEKDHTWTPQQGHELRGRSGQPYRGSVIEHLLVQNLVQFFNVGEHNIMRLENADWNDGLDMAFARGESVAFTAFYGGNLLALADLLETLAKIKKIDELSLAKEVFILLDTFSAQPCDYDSVAEKKELLFERYFRAVQPVISGETMKGRIQDIAQDLRKKGNWIFDHVRSREKVTVQDKQSYTWFNGYYDNRGQRVEGPADQGVRMTLTGQVFPIMSGLATSEDIPEIVRSVRRYLRDPRLGGYRLNTDFGLNHYLDLGRAFGFAYGTKENGAFFSHMIVMYAYGLYKRNFVREGYEVLQSIYKMCVDTDRSRIYPGIPEYFDGEGRGMYHYLTGSASWLILTVLTQAFGVRGEGGDLVLSPKLVKEEFDTNGTASVRCRFAECDLTVTYLNPRRLDYGRYAIAGVRLNGRALAIPRPFSADVTIARAQVASARGMNVEVTLGPLS